MQSTLRRDLSSSDPLRNAIPSEDVRSISKGLDSEYRDFLNASLDVRLAEARARIDAGQAQARASAQARLAQAEKKKAIAQGLEDALPTSASGSQWWVDPITGLRGQVNLTRWLFLAVQGDVGGFGAASQIAWNVSTSLGVNFTRNIFPKQDTGFSTWTVPTVALWASRRHLHI